MTGFNRRSVARALKKGKRRKTETDRQTDRQRMGYFSYRWQTRVTRLMGEASLFWVFFCSLFVCLFLVGVDGSLGMWMWVFCCCFFLGGEVGG